MPAALAHPAYADEVSDAQATLDQAESRMGQIADEYAELTAQADDLQGQIDEATAGVMEAQAAAQAGRANLGDMMSYEYKTGGLNILTVIFSSQDLADLVNNLQYLEAVQKSQAQAIEEQKRLEQEFSDALAGLNEKKDAQMEALSAAERKSEEAAQVVEGARAKLAAAEDAAAEAEAQRLAELARQAEELEAQKAEASEAQAADADDEASEESISIGSGGGSIGDGGSAGGGNAAGGSNEGSAGGSGESAADSGKGWMTGAASAYGSESDGTLGATTATGALVTETSMGVSIPTSMPNYRSYFGRAVEISYNGRTVIATVNDCGGLGGGSRALDLQPGVWKALGASSCFDWGVRTVSYRFL